MSPTARGWLMAIGSIGALVLVVQLTLDPLKKKPPPRPPAPPVPVATSLPLDAGDDKPDGGPAACAALEQRYADLREKAEWCTVDDDCAIEERDKSWFGLDDCFRASSKRAKNDARDAVAQTWKKAGCADPGEYEQCPVTPQVRCANRRCGEKPPSTLPQDWNRHVVRHLLRTFIPPELTSRDKPASNAAAVALLDQTEGGGSQLVFALDHGPKLTAANVVSSGTLLVAQKAIKIDGRPTTLFFFEDKPGPNRTTTPFHARAGLDNVNDGAIGTGLHLDIAMRCATKEACESLGPILAHTTLYVLFDTARDH